MLFGVDTFRLNASCNLFDPTTKFSNYRKYQISFISLLAYYLFLCRLKKVFAKKMFFVL